MRLRKQLMFLSLVTLALPWVGCQYIQEMDTTLRQGQIDALSATARAVSARIGSDTGLSRPFEQLNHADNALYAYPLNSSLIIDGYDDDWISRDIRPQALSNSDQHISIAAWRDKLQLLIKVRSPTFEYFNPANPSLEQSHYLELRFANRRFALFASARGQLKALNITQQGKQVSDKAIEHRIKGYWFEWSEELANGQSNSGYKLEVSLPLSWANEGLSALSVVPGTRQTDEFTLQPLIRHSQALTQELEIFKSHNVRLHLVTQPGVLIASAGTLNFPQKTRQQHGFVEWLYGLALGKPSFPILDSAHKTGTFTSTAIADALAGGHTQTWHLQGSQVIARAGLPLISSSGATIGAVIAEQSAESLASVTNDAFSRLLAYSFLASTLAGLSLVFYATWLSIRIQKLGSAAASAINENGKIIEHFPTSSSRDEIGDLSRNYALLLTRLREYTNYLRTLSSKLSHELRTPLAIVKSSLDNLEHERLSAQAKVYAERAKEGTNRLSNILNAMSAASRVEQAIGGADREIIPCDELLTNLKDAYKDVYQNVQFKLNIQTSAKGFAIYGAGELLVQALDKLVDNAADFCQDNGLVELGLYRHDDSVVITVRNEGPPLPSHMHGQLFDSMVSVREQPSQEDGHHLGLGLYIVRLITEFHQGEVHGYNVPDQSGVIFEVRLPAH